MNVWNIHGRASDDNQVKSKCSLERRRASNEAGPGCVHNTHTRRCVTSVANTTDRRYIIFDTPRLDVPMFMHCC